MDANLQTEVISAFTHTLQVPVRAVHVPLRESMPEVTSSVILESGLAPEVDGAAPWARLRIAFQKLCMELGFGTARSKFFKLSYAVCGSVHNGYTHFIAYGAPDHYPEHSAPGEAYLNQHPSLLMTTVG
jgi:hypothetical protein